MYVPGYTAITSPDAATRTAWVKDRRAPMRPVSWTMWRALPRFATSSIENSTVDIEDEFTKMIMTQTAYSTNATVFRTADEMMTVARDLKA